MGEMREYVCPACESKWTLSTGGFRRNVYLESLDNALKAFPQEQQKEIRRAAGVRPDFDFEYRAAVCCQCKHLMTVPSIRFRKTGTVFSTGCQYCGQAIPLLPEKMPLVCPACGEAILLEEDVGYWD